MFIVFSAIIFPVLSIPIIWSASDYIGIWKRSNCKIEIIIILLNSVQIPEDINKLIKD